MSNIFRPTKKDKLEVFKTNKEIDKIEEEISQLKKARSRFWIASFGVPLLVAGATLVTVGRTGFLNAWQTKNENAEHDFHNKTTQFSLDTANYNRVRDSIKNQNHILAHKSDSIQNALINLRSSLAGLNKKSLTEGEKVSLLITQNQKFAASTKHSFDSLQNAFEKLDSRRFAAEQSQHELNDNFQNCQGYSIILQKKLDAYIKKYGPNP